MTTPTTDLVHLDSMEPKPKRMKRTPEQIERYRASWTPERRALQQKVGAKLTAADVSVIRDEYPKVSIQDLAMRYHVTYEAIRRVVRGLSWTNAPGPIRAGTNSDPIVPGTVFGRLTVRARAGSMEGRGRMWDCACSCGGRKTASTRQLHSGLRSCGCLWREVIAQPRPNSRKRPYEAAYNTLVALARHRGKSCTLTYEQFLGFTREPACHYCGSQVVWNEVTVQKGPRGNNLDRIDNERGYEPGNLVVCCWECNNGRGAKYTYGEWAVMVRALVEYRKGRNGA